MKEEIPTTPCPPRRRFPRLHVPIVFRPILNHINQSPPLAFYPAYRLRLFPSVSRLRLLAFRLSLPRLVLRLPYSASHSSSPFSVFRLSPFVSVFDFPLRLPLSTSSPPSPVSFALRLPSSTSLLRHPLSSSHPPFPAFGLLPSPFLGIRHSSPSNPGPAPTSKSWYLLFKIEKDPWSSKIG